MGPELEGLVLDGRYRLQEQLGEGAMGWVWLARHLSLGRQVAVKILKTAAEGGLGPAEEYFLNEVRAVSRLTHPHIVTVIDYGRSGQGWPYLVTEFVQGRTLHAIQQQDPPLPLARILAVMHQLLSALEEAHQAGVIHGDLKPTNIMLTRLTSGEDFVKVLDFGLATLLGEGALRQDDLGLRGTPAYMAPEQLLGERATIASDLYALGCLFYELLLGELPFDGPTLEMLRYRRLTAKELPMERPESKRAIPIQFQGLIRRALAPEVRDRITGAAEFQLALGAATEGLSAVLLSCDRCRRPRDPFTGFCTMHARPAERPAVRLAIGEGSALKEVPAPPLPAPRTEPGESRLAGLRLESGGAADTAAIGSDPKATLPATVPLEALLERIRAPRTVERRWQTGQALRFLLGCSSMLEVTGEPGSGRSVLARIIGRLGAELGLQVVRAAPDPAQAGTPWYPLRILAGQLLGCGQDRPSDAGLREQLARHPLNEQQRLALLLLFGFESPGLPSAGQLRSAWMEDALLELLLSPARRLLVVLDDADQFDRSSLSFLLRLPATIDQADRGRPKLVLISERGLLQGARERNLLKLEKLTLTEAQELAQRELDREPAALRQAARQMLEDPQCCTPLELEQRIQLLREGGPVLCGPLRAILDARLDRLSGDALRLVQLVALIGGTVSTELLEALLGEQRTETGLGWLLQHRWLVTGDHRWVTLFHPALGLAALGRLTLAERRRFHAQILELLVNLNESPFVLARHARESGSWEEAVRRSEQAGHEAVRLGASEDAGLVHYRHAYLTLRWRNAEALDDALLERIAQQLVTALRDSGHLLAAQGVILEMQPWMQFPDGELEVVI